ncbi:homoserine kinase [Ideonella sp. 4Y11]|uniref:Homoserine kinase n=1 Tax=Ideonella aquatica TaxID=2824119 RepID=A0A940YM48_9BURK|nr:homoserine kinase [Ideonella aquatica]MBQ0958876.1 homoserine kinase [Ideonella aquatica]
MAVYTEVSPAQADTLLARLGLGAQHGLVPISSGIENTNYFVSTDQGEWVLTVFERLSADQLPYYLRLMAHLAAQGLPVPAPRPDADGKLVHTLAGKPAALVERLPGAPVDAPDIHHVALLGTLLARLHQAVADFPLHQPNLRGPAWRAQTGARAQAWLEGGPAELLQAELAFQAALAASPALAALPQGAVHADLFRDNALFDGARGQERLSGVFDFYFAGHDHFAYDLAVVLNDWCIDLDSGALDEARAQALLQAYQAVRPLQGAEQRLLPAMRRAAALRFWLSRLDDWHRPRDAQLLTPKDPAHFERVLRHAVDQPWHP